LIYLDGDEDKNAVSGLIYKPGYAHFNRLVNNIVNTGLHKIQDADQDIVEKTNVIAKNWVTRFDGVYNLCHIDKVMRVFTGTVLLRVTAIVAHDRYERLIEVNCLPVEADNTLVLDDIRPLTSHLKDPSELRLSKDKLISLSLKDECISKFCRFYLDRLTDEIIATKENKIKKKKLEDDFTPQIEISLVGLNGVLCREVQISVDYKVGSNFDYKSTLTVIPSKDEILNQPIMEECNITKKTVPFDCLGRCAVSGKTVLKQMLNRSETSGRTALPEHTVACELTGKCVVSDEVEKSDITGKLIASVFLKTSNLSQKRAEPEFFSQCGFTSSDVLSSELAVSQISGKKYRIDEKVISVISSKSGHQQEFILCPETNKPLLLEEAEKCEVTGKSVMPGLLELCEMTGKKVLPSELERSSATGKKALKHFFVSSSIIRSSPYRAGSCSLSNRKILCSARSQSLFLERSNLSPR